MKTFKMIQENHKLSLKMKFPLSIYLCAIFISVVLTALTIYYYPVINVDALYYFKLANLALSRGFRAPFFIYSWPFYLLLLAILHRLTQLSFLTISYFLNGIFSAIITVVFIAIIRFLGATKKQLWFGLFVISVLLISNHYQGEVLRDFGYWAFYLLSLFFSLVFARKHSFSYAGLWSASLFIAALFRIEGVIFLTFIPVTVFFLHEKSFLTKIKMAFYLYFTLFLFVILAFFILWMHGISPTQVGGYYRISDENIHGFSLAYAEFGVMLAYLSSHVLSGLSGHDIPVKFLASGLLGVYLLAIFEAVTAGFMISAVYAIFLPFEKKPERNNRHIIYLYVAINILITLLFIFQHRGFVSGRYLFALGLTLALLVPFGFSYLYCLSKNTSKKLNIHTIMFWLVCVLILITSAGSLYRFGPSKRYIYKSAIWTRENTPQTAKIYTNHAVLGYLTERFSGGYTPSQGDFFSSDKMTTSPWYGYDYVILVVSKGNKELIDQFEGVAHVQPIKVFSDNPRRGDQSYIFKLK